MKFKVTKISPDKLPTENTQFIPSYNLKNGFLGDHNSYVILNDNDFKNKYGYISNYIEDDGGYQYLDYFDNDDTKTRIQLHSLEFNAGGRDVNRAKNPTKRKQEDTAENPFVAIVVVKELFYYNKNKIILENPRGIRCILISVGNTGYFDSPNPFSRNT